MKLYLASSFNSRAAMRNQRKIAELYGHSVTSRWIDIPADSPTLPNAKNSVQEAQNDLDDIDAADTLVFFSNTGTTSGGKHIEFGYALAKGKPIVIVGDRGSVFHHLDAVKAVVDDPIKAFTLLQPA